MPDRRCQDCDAFLSDRDGWIVPFEYPDMEPLLDPPPKGSICDRCLVARRQRRTGEKYAKVR